jgi:DNA-binding transcriptional LysR family regulator
MRIDFLGLQAFVSIAECGSFQQAAAHLNLSQSALSHRMKKFEEYFGVKLMMRTTRQVTLTPAGVDLLPKALRIMSDVENSLGKLLEYSATKQEHLTIGCIPTLASHYLPNLLNTFGKKHPDITVKIYDNSATEIGAFVESGAAEFAITILAIKRSDMEVRPLLKEPFVLVAPATHPLASREFAQWSDLEGIPLVRINSQAGNRSLIDDALRDRNEHLLWRYEVQRVSTAINMVLAGNGLAVVPGLTIARMHTSSLSTVPLRNPSINREIGIMFKREGHLSPAASDLIRHVQKEMRRVKLPA